MIDFHFFGPFVFGAGFTQDGIGGQCFGVNLCN